MKRLENKVAMVTGSGGPTGIGSATAKRLAAEGASVVLADLDPALAAEAANAIQATGGTCIVKQVDLGDEASIRSLFVWVDERFSCLDLLHNNAAATGLDQMSRDMAIESLDAEVWDFAFQINARGTMLMIKHALPLVLRCGGGAIINTSSGAALRGDFYAPSYAASKAAVNCLSMYVATQYGKQGIRCNSVSPGLIMTQANVVTNSEEQLDRIKRHKLTPTLGLPEDIAAAVAYLGSDDGRFVTGQVLQVDGGITNHMPYFADVAENFAANKDKRAV
ncbi:NAD(P)-dependent dehydrogenase (Short-subunit alcohol dehydrogenase family) [Novosphingobium lubricantis]